MAPIAYWSFTFISLVGSWNKIFSGTPKKGWGGGGCWMLMLSADSSGELNATNKHSYLTLADQGNHHFEVMFGSSNHPFGVDAVISCNFGQV